MFPKLVSYSGSKIVKEFNKRHRDQCLTACFFGFSHNTTVNAYQRSFKTNRVSLKKYGNFFLFMALGLQMQGSSESNCRQYHFSGIDS